MKTLVYLLQVSACTGIFYMFYFAFLRRLTFFSLNRWYLLGTLLLSFIIPGLRLPLDAASPAEVIKPVMYINQMQVIDEPLRIHEPPTVQSPAFDWIGAIWGLYLTISAVSAVHLIITLIVFIRRKQNRQLGIIDGVKIVQSGKSGGNSSFLNTIFIAESGLSSDEVQQIIAHELLHVRLKHSVDRLIARLIQIILWFNPFVYWYMRSIEENHEYEVDRIVAADADKSGYAELLLKLSISGNDYLMHSFSKIPLKSRIAMLFNKPSSNMKKIVYALTLPVVAMSCLAFANLKSGKNTNTPPLKSKTNAKEDGNLELLGHALMILDTKALSGDDTTRYRQKVYYKGKRVKPTNVGHAQYTAWTKSAEYKRDSARVAMIQSRTLPYKVIGVLDTVYQNPFMGKIKGYKIQYGNEEFILHAASGMKPLNGLLKPGDVVDIAVFNCIYGQKNSPVIISPRTITKNGVAVYSLSQRDMMDKNPFLFEANRVRFTHGKVRNIQQYADGKWKSAVVVKENGYRIKFNIKRDAPAFRNIKEGDDVTFRFVHEVKTGAKEYTVNDWVALSNNLKDYGTKNPEFFYKFYEKM